jgi:hypothetical protein
VSTFGVLRVLTQVPKLGSLQRWVRDCDAAGDDPRALEVSECWVLQSAVCPVSTESTPVSTQSTPHSARAGGE